MAGRVVELVVCGHRYKVVSSAPEEDLRRLAASVEDKVGAATAGQKSSPQTLLLAALSLANDLEEERGRRAALEARARDILRRVIGRVDDALDDGS